MVLLFHPNDVVLLEDVAETSSACGGSYSSGGTFIFSVSDISSFSIMSCIRIHFNDDLN